MKDINPGFNGGREKQPQIQVGRGDEVHRDFLEEVTRSCFQRSSRNCASSSQRMEQADHAKSWRLS